MNNAFWLELAHNLPVMLVVLGILVFAGGSLFVILDYETHKRVRWVHYFTATITLLLFLAAIVCDSYYTSHQPKPTPCESERK